MCKLTCFSDFRRPAGLVVGLALGAELEGEGGVWERGSKGLSPPELQWAGGAYRSPPSSQGGDPPKGDVRDVGEGRTPGECAEAFG